MGTHKVSYMISMADFQSLDAYVTHCHSDSMSVSDNGFLSFLVFQELQIPFMAAIIFLCGLVNGMKIVYSKI